MSGPYRESAGKTPEVRLRWRTYPQAFYDVVYAGALRRVVMSGRQMFPVRRRYDIAQRRARLRSVR